MSGSRDQSVDGENTDGARRLTKEERDRNKDSGLSVAHACVARWDVVGGGRELTIAVCDALARQDAFRTDMMGA